MSMFVMGIYWQKSNTEGRKTLFWESQFQISDEFQKPHNLEKIDNFHVYNLLNYAGMNGGESCPIGILPV